MFKSQFVSNWNSFYFKFWSYLQEYITAYQFLSKHDKYCIITSELSNSPQIVSENKFLTTQNKWITIQACITAIIRPFFDIDECFWMATLPDILNT